MSIVKEFKEFISRGNVMDLAVGVIIGGAFGKIVSSLVADVIMPVVGLVVGGVDFTGLKVTLRVATATTPAATLNYGQFIQNTVDFLIVAFVIFAMIKLLAALRKKQEAAPVAPPAPSAEVQLLSEIRDLLKK